jgi:hypothetical protein
MGASNQSCKLHAREHVLISRCASVAGQLDVWGRSWDQRSREAWLSSMPDDKGIAYGLEVSELRHLTVTYFEYVFDLAGKV